MNLSPVAKTAAVVGILFVAGVASVGVVAGAEASITNVTVSPQEPLPGELVRFTTTIENAEGADGPFEVTSVWIRKAGTTTEYARVNDAGNVQPGSSIEVPLTSQFDSPGVKELRVRVNVVDENDELTKLEYPVTVVVSERRTQLSVDVEDAVAGAPTAVNVTVSNGGADPLRQLELRVGGDGVSAENTRRLLARLEPGTDHTFSYDVTFAEPGRTDVEAVLRYASTTGQTQTVRLDEPVTVDELREDVAVDARIAEGGGSSPPLAVEVTNFGNAPVSDAVVVPRAGDRTLPRRFVGTLAPGESTTVTVSLDGVDAATVEAVVRYDVGGRNGSAVGAFDYRPPAGELRVTDVDLAFTDDGRLLVTGNAGNAGDGEVGGVVVTMGSNEHVSPAYPQRDYFVGTVEADEFAPFELTADVDAANASRIPVRVTYRTGGETVTENVTLPYDPSLAPENRRGGSASLFPFGVAGAAAGATVGLALLVPAVYLVRRRSRR